MKSIIKKYINTLTITEVDNFSRKNGIYLNEYELNYVYNTIRNNYEVIVNCPEKIFEDANKYISNSNLEKIKVLYDDYKKKYQNYL